MGLEPDDMISKLHTFALQLQAFLLKLCIFCVTNCYISPPGQDRLVPFL